MTASACRFMPRGWRGAVSSGHLHQTVWLESRRRSSLICSMESIGGTRFIHSDRSALDNFMRISFLRVSGPDLCFYPIMDSRFGSLPNDIEALKAALIIARNEQIAEVARAVAAEAELAVARAKAS